MGNSVIVLGSKGRFGRAAVQAFAQAGWQVTAAQRGAQPAQRRENVKTVTCDAMDARSLCAACAGADVIVNALNPPYVDWADVVPTLTKNVIAAAVETGATVMIPGNIYNFGTQMPEVLRADTPHAATTRKGIIRRDMEQTYRAATARGVQTIVLRSGDYIDGRDTGNWLESHMAHKIAKGRFTYPGPLDRVHAWAYLPDKARAMAGLAAQRATLGQFEDIGFEGYSVTGQQLADAIAQQMGRTLRIKFMPWALLRVVALFQPFVREVLELKYQWERPHRVDGTRLHQLLPAFEPTPLEVCLQKVLPAPPAPQVKSAAEAL